jgi:hypothetical protein
MALVVTSGVRLLLRALGVTAAPTAKNTSTTGSDLARNFEAAAKHVDAKSAQVVCLYSAAYLYAKAICDLDKASPERKELETAFFKAPAQPETKGVSVSRFRNLLCSQLKAADNGDHVPPYTVTIVGGRKASKPTWVGVNPGMRLVCELVSCLEDKLGLGDARIVCARNYDVEGQGCKISWAQGLSQSITPKAAGYVVDVGGNGNLKLINGHTSNPVGKEVENTDISGDGQALLDSIQSLLKEHSVSPADTALGMTGKWREGPRRHANAVQVLSKMQGAGFAAAQLVSEPLERAWEHASAKRAVHQLLPGQLSEVAVLTIGSGSSTTQVGVSARTSQFSGCTIDAGVHIKPPTDALGIFNSTLRNLQKQQ